jgi:hypothetical protein
MPPEPRAERIARLRVARGEREALALSSVRQAGAEAGMDVSGAGIWRVGSSIMVGLPEARVLGRVDDPARFNAASRQVAVSEVLGERGVPCITVTGPARQPVATAAGPLTFWRWLDSTDAEVGPRTLGRLARALHEATRGGVDDVPAFQPLVAVADELERARLGGRSAAADLDLLAARISSVLERWPVVLDDPLGIAVVHGDLHRHNAVATAGGAVLADLELAGVGPVCADLVPQVVAVRRYGAPPRTIDEMFAGYGLEPVRWPGFELLVDAHELWVTVWTVANRGLSPALEDEAEVRLDRWRPGAGSPRPWRLH